MPPASKRRRQRKGDASNDSSPDSAPSRKSWSLYFFGMVAILCFQTSSYIFMEGMPWGREIMAVGTTVMNVTLDAMNDLSDTYTSFTSDDNSTSTTAHAHAVPSFLEDYRPPGFLRFDWRHLPVQSTLAKHFQHHQSQRCDLPLFYFKQRNNAGLGSDLHVYGMALCNAHRRNVRMFSPQPWMYWDEQVCQQAIVSGNASASESSMACYFPKLELQCPNDTLEAPVIHHQAQQLWQQNRHHRRVVWETHEDMSCSSIVERPGFKGLFNIMDVRSAITEFVFSEVSPVVMQEAQRQHALVFKNGAPPSHQLITVHVRWGDKGREMSLQPIETYIKAVHQMAHDHNLQPHETHIFLASEDPAAVAAFKNAMDPRWHLYIDQFYTEMLPYRNNKTQEVAGAAKSGFGRTGLLALGSVMVSMESNMFILSTGSNWSRLMNELRKNIVRPRCHWPGQSRNATEEGVDCTSMIDVQPTGSAYETGRKPNHQNTHQSILNRLNAMRNTGGNQNRGYAPAHPGAQPQRLQHKTIRQKMFRYPRLQYSQNDVLRYHRKRQGGRR